MSSHISVDFFISPVWDTGHCSHAVRSRGALPQVWTQDKVRYCASVFPGVGGCYFFLVSLLSQARGHCSHAVRSCATLPQVLTQDKVCYCSSILLMSVFLYLSSLKHGATVHTQFDLVPPYPKFEPRIRYVIAIPLFPVSSDIFLCLLVSRRSQSEHGLRYKKNIGTLWVRYVSVYLKFEYMYSRKRRFLHDNFLCWVTCLKYYCYDHGYTHDIYHVVQEQNVSY